VHGGPDELALTDGDVFVLATKTQDAAAAIALWAEQPVTLADGTTATAGTSLPLLTTQNGLETKRIALRFFATVFGGVLALPANYVRPGVVVSPGAPAVGLAWIGAYPDRDDPQVEAIARDLRRANIETQSVSDISRWKRGKLVVSTTFVLDALYAQSPLRDRAGALLREEAQDVFAAAGEELADLTLGGSRPAKLEVRAVPGYEYGGTSTWQSLARSGSLETDFINGEVVLQARLAGRTAPGSEAINRRIHAAAAEGIAPRSLGDDDLLTTFPQLRDVDPPDNDVLIDPLSLYQQLRGPNPPALFDVRWKLGDPDGCRHYADAHIPTAAYVDLDTELAAAPSAAEGRHPLPDVEKLQAAARRWGVSARQPVVVYDDNGGTSAARAWWLLRWAGVQDVRVLDGALAAWTGTGLPLERGVPTITSGDVTLTGQQLPLLDADEAVELAQSGVLLDARAHERYRGDHEPVDSRAGHIPGAVSAPTTENLASDGRFLDPDALRARFAALGVDTSSQVGVYCGSGVTAAHQIAALRIAGIEAALFPGSWSAWSADPRRPVAVGALPS
jgi:thiosulfate/3-mercaptopyruvate sulfurtransferase